MKYEIGNFGWLGYKKGYILRCGKPVIKTGTEDNWQKYLWLLNTTETEPAYVAYENMNGKHVEEDLDGYMCWINALERELYNFGLSLYNEDLIEVMESIYANKKENCFVVNFKGKEEVLGDIIDESFIEMFNGSIHTLLIPLIKEIPVIKIF